MFAFKSKAIFQKRLMVKKKKNEITVTNKNE